MTRITDQQIETARTAFRNGKSIPECCSIARMSKASFNKYLGKEVQVWIDEHNAAKEQRERVSEIMPITTNFDEVVKQIADEKASDSYVGLQTNKDVIKYYKSRFNVKYLPAPSDSNSWREIDLYRYLVFLISKGCDDRLSFNDSLFLMCSIDSVDAAKSYFNELYEIVSR